MENDVCAQGFLGPKSREQTTPSSQAVWVLKEDACPVSAPPGQNQLQVGRTVLRLELWA